MYCLRKSCSISEPALQPERPCPHGQAGTAHQDYVVPWLSDGPLRSWTTRYDGLPIASEGRLKATILPLLMASFAPEEAACLLPRGCCHSTRLVHKHCNAQPGAHQSFSRSFQNWGTICLGISEGNLLRISITSLSEGTSVRVRSRITFHPIASRLRKVL